ncbi:MAG: M36 family metallopeptidase [Bacteroidota bacterium]
MNSILFQRSIRWQTSRFLLSLIALLLIHAQLAGQSAEAIAREWMVRTAPQYQLSSDDIKSFFLTSEHISSSSGAHHLYCRQAHEGIEVNAADWSFHLDAAGALLVDHQQFVRNLGSKIRPGTASLGARSAVKNAATDLGYALSAPLEEVEAPRGNNQEQILSAGGVSLKDIPLRLVYHLLADQYVLAWDILLYEIQGTAVWSYRINAGDGRVLARENLVIECAPTDLGHHSHTHHDRGHKSHPPAAIPAAFGTALASPTHTYRVYPMPIENPNHGVLTTVCDPANLAASPFRWHDLDGDPTSESFTTFGNNVYAFENGNNVGFSPIGGTSLNFEFPHDPSSTNPDDYEAAAVTNLFYWNNIVHDVLHHYGFDETSGNFQNLNYTGTGLGNDFVLAHAQAPGSCNANFFTPVDGTNPIMNMFNCGGRDGDFDNLVIVHEYGHGISLRLVGGAGNTSVLNNSEQMGEGWSDWYGLVLSIQAGHLPTDARGAGTWLLGEGPDGEGIRPHPYSTDKTINPDTYGNLPGLIAPHGVGYLWAQMLWEMTWGLIDEHGYDADFYTGVGGNNIALALVTEALKLTPTSPGFVDGRDAILLADELLYGGANQCIIWRAFAKRGLGWSADQGSPFSKSDGTEAFDLPEDCDCPPLHQVKRIANDDQVADYYGYDVEVQGNVALVGAYAEDTEGSNAGAVYVYTRTGTNNWDQVQKIVAPDANAGDQFGRSVAIGRGFILIGAPYDDDDGTNSGSAYLYRYDYLASSYLFFQKITAWDGAAYDYFGTSVALYNRMALVGATGDDDNGSSSGSAYLYRYSGTSWGNFQKLLASDGATGDRFGVSVDIFNANLVVGASWDDDLGGSSGSAYVYHQPSTPFAFSQVAKLLASDGGSLDYFGHSVAIGLDKIIVGAFQRESVNGGKAYAFHQQEGTNNWPEQQILVPDDNAPGDYLGWSVALRGDRAVIGARLDDNANGSNAGSAYVYDYYAGYWCMTHRLLADDGAVGDGFAYSVALDQHYVAVGAPFNDDGGSSSGSAYFFTCGPESSFRSAEPEPVTDRATTDHNWTVELFPNPNSGESIHLRINGLEEASQTLRLRLVDLTGRTIFEDQWWTDGREIARRIELPRDLSKGFYLVTIETERKQLIEKLVIE